MTRSERLQLREAERARDVARQNYNRLRSLLKSRAEQRQRRGREKNSPEQSRASSGKRV